MVEIKLEEQIAGETEARKAKMAEVNQLAAQITSLDATMKQMAAKRQELVTKSNQAATRAVELQGVIRYLKQANGQKTSSPAEVKIAEPAEETPEPPEGEPRAEA